MTQVPGAHLVHFVNRSGMSDPETMWKRHDTSRVLYYRKWYGWLGTTLLRWSKWMLKSPFWKRWRKAPPHGPMVDLGESVERPLIVLPRSCEKFLLLMSLDSRFYLSGGVFGSGDRWTPSDVMYHKLRLHDVLLQSVQTCRAAASKRSGSGRYRCLSHLGVPVPEAATEKSRRPSRPHWGEVGLEPRAVGRRAELEYAGVDARVPARVVCGDAAPRARSDRRRQR